MRYLSAPLFPVQLRELPCELSFHEAPSTATRVGNFEISASLICHPGPTVGYRIKDTRGVLAYLSDHEPALGKAFPLLPPDWTSGHVVAQNADLLIHDAQYTDEEYAQRVGWGHSSMKHAIHFAALARVKHLVLFYHDPAHDDPTLDRMLATSIAATEPAFAVTAAQEGAVFEIA